MELGRVVRIIKPVASNEFLVEYVNIPHDQGSRSEVVCTLPRHSLLSPAAVVPFASYFDCENGCAFEKLAACTRPDVKRSVGAERLAVREADDESRIIGISATQLSPSTIFAQTHEYLSGHCTGQVSCGVHKYQFPIYNLGLTVPRNVVEVFNRCFSFRCAHIEPSHFMLQALFAYRRPVFSSTRRLYSSLSQLAAQQTVQWFRYEYDRNCQQRPGKYIDNVM